MNKTSGSAFSLRTKGVIGLLLAINVLNFLDRQLPFMLIEAIKHDLSLTDKQIGLLGGITFAVVYSVGGIPLGRLADSGMARGVVSGAVAFWSLMTGLSGMAQNFVQLVMTRIGVAGGEAGATPGAHAIIAGIVPQNRRAFAISVFSLGTPIGNMLGLALGGLLLEWLNWRHAFLVVAVPGMVLALLARFALPASEPAEKSSANKGSLGAVVHLLRIRTFRRTAVAAATFAAGGYSMITFLPGFLMRSHGLSPSQTGIWLGLITGIAGVIGTLTSGWLADKLGEGDMRWRLRIPALLMGMSVPFLAAAFIVGNKWLAIGLLFFPQMFTVSYLAPMFTGVHLLVPQDMRATASAATLASLTLVGATVGPYAVGFVSDAIRATYGAESLRMAMQLVPAFLAISSAVFFAAARSLPEDALPEHR